MNGKSLTYTGVVTLIVGVVLLFMQSTAIDIVVMVLGIAFLIAAAVNLFFVFSSSSKVSVEVNGKKESHASLSIGSLLSAVAAAALGLWMVIRPSGFSSLLVYVFAALMILAGIYHIFMLLYGFGKIGFPFVFYILPILLVVTGVVVLVLGPVKMMNFIVLVTGISLIAYSVCNFLEAARVSSQR
ncbi:MAG: DUF308 domain-containing protein [Muribaculaceae bacterium]|nr:DUF308 domain-containing protein [Muribaculaceae bacterium]